MEINSILQKAARDQADEDQWKDQAYLSADQIVAAYMKKYSHDPLIEFFLLGNGKVTVDGMTFYWSYSTWDGYEIQFDDSWKNTPEDLDKAVERLRKHLVVLASQEGSAIRDYQTKWNGSVKQFLDNVEKQGLVLAAGMSPKQMTLSSLERLNEGVAFTIEMIPVVGFQALTAQLVTGQKMSFTVYGQRELSTTERIFIVGDLASDLVAVVVVKVGKKWVAKGVSKVFPKLSDALSYMRKFVPIRGASFFDDLATAATKNADSTKLVLGKWSKTGQSYQKVAAHFKATYFKLANWRELEKILSREELWKINESFLNQQLRAGKEVILSHDPSKASGFFLREVDYLKDLGYRFVRDGWVWRAVK